jgi:hypothetical protein
MVKRLFNSIAMMHIDVHIHHSRVGFQKFENTDNNVIDIAKSAGF